MSARAVTSAAIAGVPSDEVRDSLAAGAGGVPEVEYRCCVGGRREFYGEHPAIVRR